MRGEFNRQCEETDLSLRLLDAGWVTRLGNSKPVLHYESPVRDRSRIVYYQTRNNLLLVLLDMPLVILPLHYAVTARNVVRAGLRAGYPAATLRGVVSATLGGVTMLRRRRPVRLTTYRLFRMLRRGAQVTLAQVEDRLPLQPQMTRQSGG